jgi:hypothetical protein
MGARFLGSEIVELCTSSGPESIKIHEKLFASKCKGAAGAFKHDFAERTRGRYAFTETTLDTVAQFTEWAYTGDYTDTTVIDIDVPESIQDEDSGNGLECPPPSPPVDGGESKTVQAHTLLGHLRLYKFSEIYLVPQLNELAFSKFTAVLVEMGKPKNLQEQLVVIDCLSLAFSELLLGDELQQWLARYAAWSLESLRHQTEFQDLLQTSPALSSRMMDMLIPVSEPPWSTKFKAPKSNVPLHEESPRRRRHNGYSSDDDDND